MESNGECAYTVKQVIGGVYDVLDPQTSFEQQAEQLKIVFEAHAGASISRKQTSEKCQKRCI